MSRWFFLIFLLMSLMACRSRDISYEPLHAPFLQGSTAWADSVLLTMSLDEKIGQLLIYQPELKDSLQRDSLIQLAQNQKLAGVLLEGLRLYDYIHLVNKLQAISRIPLFNASKQDLVLQNQFSDLPHLPSAATLSAFSDDSLKNLLQTKFLEQVQKLQINLSLSANLNVNIPESGTYDFTVLENEESQLLDQTIDKVSALQRNHILTTAGDFNELYYFEQDTCGIIDSILFQYNRLVKAGISGIYVDPTLFKIDTIQLLPPHFLKRYLDIHTEFKGLLIADWDDRSFKDIAYAGVDVFIVKDSFTQRFNYLRQLVDQGQFTLDDLHQKVQKVLMAKAWMQSDKPPGKLDQLAVRNTMLDFFDEYEQRSMYESAMTLVQNPQNTIPFKHTYKEPFRIIQYGEKELWEFQKYFSKYASFSAALAPIDTSGALSPLSEKRYRYSNLIITLDQQQIDPERDTAFIRSVNHLSKKKPLIIANFGNPYNLTHFDSTVILIQNYERNDWNESLTAQLLFGGLNAQGILPVALNERLPVGTGITNTPIVRLKYTVPEEVGIAAYKLVGIDAIARSIIREKGTPGCQVLVAKEGKVIYSKSFGKHSFRKGKNVQKSDLYDLASITKVASTTLGIMKLYDQKEIKLNQPLKKYLDFEKRQKVKNIRLNQLLTHQSGLQSNMPIARYIMHKDTTGTGCDSLYCNTKKAESDLQIADTMYMASHWRDSIWNEVFDLDVRRRKRYRYSDVNFNLLMKVLEEKSGKTIDAFVTDEFYKSMNINRLTYKPLSQFKKEEVVPTTKEDRFRNQLIQGYVHDESAALMGGVAGNAGLFGNAESLATLFQMLLNEGEYGGKKYLEASTIQTFSKQQRGSKRGLGFDVNTRHGTRGCSPKASPQTYGHTGFTGTCVWVDPESELIFIFLSNRIHPDVRNRKLFKKRTRVRMHNLVYEALNTYPEMEQKQEEVIMHANVGGD